MNNIKIHKYHQTLLKTLVHVIHTIYALAKH